MSTGVTPIRAAGAPEPPGEPDRAVVAPAGQSRERLDRHAARRADGGADRRRNGREPDDIRGTAEALPAVGVAIDQKCADEPFQRIADRDPRRGDEATGGGEVHGERAEEN